MTPSPGTLRRLERVINPAPDQFLGAGPAMGLKPPPRRLTGEGVAWPVGLSLQAAPRRKVPPTKGARVGTPAIQRQYRQSGHHHYTLTIGKVENFPLDSLFRNDGVNYLF